MGVSADPVGRQKEFDELNELNFPLLSDTKKTVAKQFGVKRAGPLPSKRVTFVIDADRTVAAIVTGEMSFEKHADEALEAVRALA